MQTSVAAPKVYRIARAAAELGISRAGIYRMASAGIFRLIRITPHASGILAEDIDRWLQSKREAAAGGDHGNA